MHAAFPCFAPGIQHVLHLGTDEGGMAAVVDRVTGKLAARGMAVILQLGFGLAMRPSPFRRKPTRKAQAFFDENFVILDPTAPDGRRYYQGKFLIRTKKPGDDMNVLLRFCPDPDKLFRRVLWFNLLDPKAVADTEVLTEEEADRIQQDPGRVDLVIRFPDVDATLDLVRSADVDIVDLLLENAVQITGHVGHLFKLGAIAKNIELALDLPRLAALAGD